MNNIKVVANVIFICESLLIPESSPKHTLINPIRVITAMMMT